MARILIIDDEEAIRRPLSLLLTRAGHEVLTACDGAEGLRLWREFGADLVITDIFMPNKDGMETMLELNTAAPTLPVIAMSGGEVSQRLDVLGGARMLGAVRTIAKPFLLSEMLATIRDVLTLKEG
jgi:DNA-binding response OmpR family regulator